MRGCIQETAAFSQGRTLAIPTVLGMASPLATAAVAVTGGCSTPLPRPRNRTDPLKYDSTNMSAIADWMRSIESNADQCLSRGGVFCVELRDRAEGGDSLTVDRLRAIWNKLDQQFGGITGMGFLGPERAFVVTEDESCWTSVAACVVETAVSTGMAAHDIGVGVGFARVEHRGQPTADILRLATSAASHASDAGIGFTARSLAEEERQRRRSLIRQSLEAALMGQEGLRLIYQPKVDAISGAIVGAEALLRFECPEFGPVATMELLDVAEACGEMVRLDRWALGLAVESLQVLKNHGIAALPISVNIRAETAFERGFVEFVAGTLATFDVAPGLLQIEIREDEALADTARAEVLTAALAKVGVATALDGFGRNHTTLTDLRKLHVSTLKLDRGIVREMMSNPKNAQLAQGMMHLARILRMETVAVGIETAEQRDYMRDAGCTSLQGFLFHRPMEADELLRELQGEETQAA